MAFDLNLLLTFEALDKARSVSGAARMLNLSQPATSAALGRLRSALQDEVFTYAGGMMQPTPTARRMAPGIHAALRDLRGTLGAERPFDPATARESFTIGVTDYASAVIGPALSAAMAAEAPGVDLRLQAYDKAGVAALIDGGTLDVVIGTFSDPPDRSVATPLLQERFIGIARTGHPALNQSQRLPQNGPQNGPKNGPKNAPQNGPQIAPMTASRFAALDHALFTLGRDARGAIDAALAAQGLERRVRLTLPHLMALPEILRTTDLVAAVPARAAARFGPGLTTFDLGFLDLGPWTLHMLWQPFARNDRAHAWLRATLTRVCREI